MANINPEFNSNDSIGDVGKQIGSGPHARTNIVWLVCRLVLIIGGGITFALVILYGVEIYQAPAEMKKDLSLLFVDVLKSIWSIFIPILTLALGYLFGKGRE